MGNWLYWCRARPSPAERAEQRLARRARIKSLKREIMIARSRSREYDHFLAELKALEKDDVDDFEDEMVSRR